MLRTLQKQCQVCQTIAEESSNMCQSNASKKPQHTQKEENLLLSFDQHHLRNARFHWTLDKRKQNAKMESQQLILARK